MTAAEQDMMACFRQDYLDLLGGRVSTIQRLVSAGHVEPARVALLSLESSSAMVGENELATVAKRLRVALAEGSGSGLDALMAQLVADAESVRSGSDRQEG
jgi:hypothetical protein